MSLNTNCPGCQRALALGEHLLGKNVRCKNCGHVFTVEETHASNEQDEGSATPEQDQEQREILESPEVEEESEPAPVLLSEQMLEDLPTIPSLRQERWKLIIGLAINSVAMFLLGGAVALAIVLYGGPSWRGTLELLDSDFRGSWPSPAPPGGFVMGLRFPEELTVTLHIAAVVDDNTREAIYSKAALLADGGHGGISGAQEGERMTLLVTPVLDPQAFARKLDFGTVRRVMGRTISVVAYKVEGPPPNADALTKILFYVKSPNFTQRFEGAQRLKKMEPNERREEVARALHEALAKDTNHFSREEILEALAVWGTKDSVPVLLNTLNALEAHDFFTRRAIFHALARFPDERACEPLALHLEDHADRRDAAEALKALGPMAEKAVLKRLQHPDPWVRSEACRVLRVIGTKQSLPALEKATAEDEGFMHNEAQGATQAIKARQK